MRMAKVARKWHPILLLEETVAEMIHERWREVEYDI